MAELLSNEEYWSRPELVAAHSGLPGMLDYERDAVADAITRATSTGRLDEVHVLGVGPGRELAGIRALAGSARIHAWDVSGPMVDACRAHVEQHRWNDVMVHHAAIDQMAERIDRPADIVVGLSAVLGYLPTEADRRRSVAAVRRICRPGAGLAVVVQQRHGRAPWVPYFAALSALERVGLRRRGDGNRPSRYGDGAVLVHHFRRREIDELIREERFGDIDVRSLREWAGGSSRRIPRRSPNPLIVTATAR